MKDRPAYMRYLTQQLLLLKFRRVPNVKAQVCLGMLPNARKFRPRLTSFLIS